MKWYSKRFAFDLGPQKEEERRSSSWVPFPRVKLPSKYERCSLSMDIIHPYTLSTVCCLINVRLGSLGDTLGDTFPYRFNALSPDDHALVDQNGLVDAWFALHEKEGLDGATLDKVATLSVEAEEMEVLNLKSGEDSDYTPHSDHYGLSLGFTI
ncbi:hypothetical protein K438DRAFT_1909263 [Mycena galopus ATCC 62051]|nr:hypothetical protein K438DRAFT_1909263 [Mycena galopus ATCC 62051]